jgi:hypothetical protein
MLASQFSDCAAGRSVGKRNETRRVGVLVGLECAAYVSALTFGDRHVAQVVLPALVIGLGCLGALLVMFLMARRGRP